MNWKTACAALLLAVPCLGAEPAPAIKIDLGQPPAAQGDAFFKTEDQKILYALGVAVGQQIQQFKLSPAEVKLVVTGFKDVASAVKPKVELGEYGPKLNAWLQARHDAQSAGLMAAEKKKAKGFLEKAVKEKGAQVFPSGLIIIESAAGTGEMPQATDSIKAHYKGTTIEGTVFDSSYERGKPTDFELNHVIRCWTEAFQKIKVGGKARLICPPEVAYGANPPPGAKFGPGATLIFDVELIGINDGEKKKAKSFLENAAKEKGAQVFPSGLIILESAAGTGELPKPIDSIKAHYKGTTIEGEVFDSSYERGQPTDFELNHVIPCWTEAFQKIKVGGKGRLICPPGIAYGANPPPGAKFGPGATLVFDVELIGINK